ncbi:MAG: DnaB-like helicase C-terminal domain-containing protein [Deltaproteobacteria bacterium]|nr:DnaB-like helicase C-terminal domain-containing protein [Deltaproteobacteria bacterium]
MSFYAVRDFIQNVFLSLESKFDQSAGKGQWAIVKTGFKKIDEAIGGLKPGELVLISGWGGVGKSAFCHNIAEYMAVKERQPVAIFSPGRNKEELVQRIIAAKTGISIRRLISGTFEAFKWGRITDIVTELYDAPLYIDDSKKQKIEDITKAIAELSKIYAVRLIIIDSLQNIKGSREIGSNLQALKNLARKCQVPLIVTAELSNAIIHGRPDFTDLRTTGICEEDVDTIVFIHRSTEDYASLQGQTAEIIVAKHPRCRPETFELAFVPALLRFEREGDLV